MDLSDDLRIGAGSEVGSGPGTGGIYLKWLSRISRTTKKPPADTQVTITTRNNINATHQPIVSVRYLVYKWIIDWKHQPSLHVETPKGNYPSVETLPRGQNLAQ